MVPRLHFYRSRHLFLCPDMEQVGAAMMQRKYYNVLTWSGFVLWFYCFGDKCWAIKTGIPVFSHSYHQVPSSVYYYFHMEFTVQYQENINFFLFSFLSCIFRTWVCRSMFSAEERRRKKEVSMHGVTHSWPVYVNTQALAPTKLRSCVKVEVAVPSWAPQGVPNTSLLLIVLMVSVDVQQIQLEPTHTNLN